MSLLCIGVQNATTVVGVVDADATITSWRVSTDLRRTADEWALLVGALVDRAPGADPVHGVAVCSAVPAVTRELRTMLAADFGGARHVVAGPGVRTGLPVLTDNPREVGTDRIAHAMGAVDLCGAPVVVVDVGSATTFDVVDGEGRYVGGAIAPGVQLSLDALGVHGAQLRQVELVAPRTAIAKNTVEALQSGAVFGFAGQVDGLVGRILAELDAPGAAAVPVVGTGHLAPAVLAHCASLTRHEPELMLRGLRLLYARNAA